ncbi:transglutaminase TgpA family protein [Actinokineospora spheciospongiae]|uniref:transglutaminase TgpA family protein n=1 Tax=Actinokineospora spheciospongiae TaxID=909613 RepID=UPI000D716040|nr:DUF3488 and transglutaminase-like domain-containing protein [Actinokineospora spheciospongiae]PWW62556.1 transglutaminase superfamily protein [Actinokineospora spheciospongiae]
MTTTQHPPQHAPRPPAPPEHDSDAVQWTTTVTPAVAAVTTLCASTALSGVIDGVRWLGYAGVAIIVVAAVGMGLRAMRTPTAVVGLAQLFALLCLLVALFTNEGVVGILPGPDAIGALGDVLGQSVEAVRVGVPPVGATAPVLCLVVIAIGLVAVLVDTLAVAAGAPAACGLVLLCVYAVPASLSDELLPWWSFVLGAISFAGLLAVDGTHRHHLWRNRPAMPATGRGLGAPVAVVASALALGLVAGLTATGIGTVGGFPGGGGGGGGGGLALKPFTALRGMLDQGSNVELFRVRGLGNESRYLRAMTLPRFDRNGGWTAADALSDAVPADGDLPNGLGDDGGGAVTRIEIEPVNSQDLWAPVYGIPRRLSDLPPDMYYDQNGGMVYSRSPRKLDRYVEDADLGQPAAQDLRSAGTRPAEGLDPVYLGAEGIDPEVVDLARQLTADQPTTFDKALALQKYFDPVNGFKYQTQTGTSSDEDALEEFLFRSKVGFCEQYASAMGVLARAAGIPSRVAIGYTAGFVSGDYRSITTQDAHAWVEVYFPDQGWVSFDPTPLSDGRGYQPPYVQGDASTGPSTTVTEEEVPGGSTENTPTAQAPETGTADDQQAAAPNADGGGFSLPWQVWLALALIALAGGLAALGARAAKARSRTAWRPVAAAAAAAVLAVFFLVSAVSWWLGALVVVLVAAAVPAAVRAWRRREHQQAVAARDTDAAGAAWAELMAESWDRGAETAESDTVRTAARRLVKEHGLDRDGQEALRTVVNSVERSWYGGRADAPELPAAFDEVVRGLRRTAPMDWKSRLLPRSVLKPRRRKQD